MKAKVVIKMRNKLIRDSIGRHVKMYKEQTVRSLGEMIETLQTVKNQVELSMDNQTSCGDQQMGNVLDDRYNLVHNYNEMICYVMQYRTLDYLIESSDDSMEG
jgi:hypothetical protein